MDISSELLELTGPIEKTIADFQKHTDVNKFIESLSRELSSFAEAIAVSIIQPLLDSLGFLEKQKAIGAKKALRFNGYRDICVRLVTGQRIPLRSPYFTKAKPKKRGKRKKGSGGGHLALQWIGFVDLISMQLASVAAQSALLCPSFEIARQTLQHHGIELGVKTIQRICQLIGRQAMDNRQCIAMSDLDRVDDRMVLVCIDGGRIRERKKKRGRRPAGQKRQGYHTDWREPTQIVIQCFNADGSKCKDFLPLYDATTGKIDQVFELVESYLRQMQISTAEHVVFCADGDRRYWKRFGPLAKKLQITDHFEVIDYTHAKQNLLQIIEKLPKKMDPRQKTKVIKQWNDLLWKGDLHEINRQIADLITSKKNKKAALAKFKSYFLNNFHRMHYVGFRYFNVATGSGCVESAIRRVINLRLKSPGIFWKCQTAEVMLFLRSTLLCGRWKIMLDNLLLDNRGQFAICT